MYSGTWYVLFLERLRWLGDVHKICTQFLDGVSELFFDNSHANAHVSSFGCTLAEQQLHVLTRFLLIAWSPRAPPFAYCTVRYCTEGVLFTLYRRVEITGVGAAFCCGRACHARWRRRRWWIPGGRGGQT